MAKTLSFKRLRQASKRKNNRPTLAEPPRPNLIRFLNQIREFRTAPPEKLLNLVR